MGWKKKPFLHINKECQLQQKRGEENSDVRRKQKPTGFFPAIASTPLHVNGRGQASKKKDRKFRR